MSYEIKTCPECRADLSREPHRFWCTPIMRQVGDCQYCGVKPGYLHEESCVMLKRLSPTEKPSNPKDAVGIRKAPLSTVSAPVLAELGVAMLEGARKYGRHNYRVIGVRASVYYDATIRHLMQWWEGEDTDIDSGLSHITKAIASLVVLRDAMLQQKFVDDRPPVSRPWIAELNKKAGEVIDKYPDAKPAVTQIDASWAKAAAE